MAEDRRRRRRRRRGARKNLNSLLELSAYSLFCAIPCVSRRLPRYSNCEARECRAARRKAKWRLAACKTLASKQAAPLSAKMRLK